jgi:hypothetical protein
MGGLAFISHNRWTADDVAADGKRVIVVMVF